MFYSEKTQSPIPPYMCHGLCALRYGWSAMVPWSRLFLLHVHGLCARRYGLWASQGRERSTELIARTPLLLRISPSYFDNRRAAHVPLCSLWRRPSLRSLPTRAIGFALCVMGGWLWFLGHACSSYTCTGSALDIMDYGLAEAIGFSSELTARTLLILCIIALWLKLRRFFHRNTSKLHTHAPYNIYTHT